MAMYGNVWQCMAMYGNVWGWGDGRWTQYESVSHVDSPLCLGKKAESWAGSESAFKKIGWMKEVDTQEMAGVQ